MPTDHEKKARQLPPEMVKKIRNYLRQGIEATSISNSTGVPRPIISVIRRKWRKEYRKANEPMPVWLWDWNDPEPARIREKLRRDAKTIKEQRRLWAETALSPKGSAPTGGLLDLDDFSCRDDIDAGRDLHGKVYKTDRDEDD